MNRSSKQPRLRGIDSDISIESWIAEARMLSARLESITKEERQRAVDIVLSFIEDPKDTSYWYNKKLKEMAHKIKHT